VGISLFRVSTVSVPIVINVKETRKLESWDIVFQGIVVHYILQEAQLLQRNSASAAHMEGESYLAPFLRYGDLLAKNCLFFLPVSHSAPSLPMFPLEFCGEVKREETRVIGLSYSE